MTVQPEKAAEPSKALAAAAAGGLPAFTSSDNPFSDTARREGVQDGLYLRMDGNNGEFKVFPTGDKLEHGTPLAFHFWYAKLGWQGFDRANNNKGVKGPSVDIRSGAALPPAPDDNPDIQWQKIVLVPVRALDGSPQMLLSSKADKPTREILKLMKNYGSLMGRHRDEKGINMIPIVEIGARSFQMEVEDETKPRLSTGKFPKVKVTKYSESYKIVEWLSEAQLREIEDAGVVEAEAGEAQAAAGEAQAAAAVEEAQVIEHTPPQAQKPAGKPAVNLGLKFGRYGARPGAQTQQG